ncbi:MAG: ROK family protein [Planctomycetota bacterium]
MPTRTAWLGIDIGASSTKLALLHTDPRPAGGLRTPDEQRQDMPKGPASVGRGLAKLGQSAIYDRPTLEALGAAVRGAAEALLDREKPTAVCGVGLAVPGPVGEGGVVEQCGNLPALDAVEGGVWLHDALAGVIDADVPVHVTPDTNAAAVGAYTDDPKRGRTLFLSLGTGVGGAVLDDGEPLALTRGTPGHLGHIDISGGDPDAPATEAAGRGALEAYLGAKALRAAGLPLDDPDACAQHPAMPNAINALARGLRIMLALYRMDHIVLLGGVAPVFAPHLEDVRRRTREGLTHVAPQAWNLAVAATGVHTAAVGAALLGQSTRRFADSASA